MAWELYNILLACFSDVLCSDAADSLTNLCPGVCLPANTGPLTSSGRKALTLCCPLARGRVSRQCQPSRLSEAAELKDLMLASLFTRTMAGQHKGRPQCWGDVVLFGGITGRRGLESRILWSLRVTLCCSWLGALPITHHSCAHRNGPLTLLCGHLSPQPVPEVYCRSQITHGQVQLSSE